MGLFDKVVKTASNIGAGVAKTAGNVGSSVSVAAQEQSELVALKSQINVIEQELNSSYVQIGRKYVDYVIESGEMPGIDVTDILKLIDPKITKKQELEKRIIELEKEIKAKNVLREKQQAEEEFLAEKTKLDKALGMDVISKDEYDMKIAIARKKVDNFEEIRRIEQQADMGLITKEEKAMKIEALLK
ncbi:MAG: hypothetical protein E7583_08575 [Ruminococcaceae bacterium]|nr:hypothetical protein [Oscillospiraceae bacterium]